MTSEIFIAFAIYALILGGISYFFSSKTSSESFMLGSRSTNYWVTAIALQASDMTHWLFIGLPFIVYTTGLITFWESVGLVFFMFLSWHFIATKLRIETERYNCNTIFSYFEKKFNDNSGTIRLLSSVISVVFMTFYISSGLVALGHVFENVFGMPYIFGVLLGLLIAVLYTLIGGFLAIAWCDFFQGIYVFFMIILVPTVAFFAIGGWAAISQAAQLKGVSLSIFPATLSIYSILIILGKIFTFGPGYFGQTYLMTFFMGIDDPKKMKYAKYVGLSWQIIVLIFAMFMGVVGIAYFNGAYEGELIYILLANKLFSPLMAGFVLCALLAVTLSALGTKILNSGSVLAEDFYKIVINKNASSNNLRLMTRIFAISVCLVALFIAFDDSKTIYELVLYAWSGMGSAFGPLVISALYSNKVNKYGAISGIITGSLVSGIWYIFGTGVPPLIPGFIASYIAIYLISYLTKNKVKLSYE